MNISQCEKSALEIRTGSRTFNNDKNIDNPMKLCYKSCKVLWLTQNNSLEIAEQLAIGDSTRNIAKNTGVSQSTVSRLGRDPEIRKLVDEIRESHFKDNLQRAKDNFTHFIKECTTTENNSIRFLGYKASERTLESAGVLNSPYQSVFIANIYNDHSTTLISPVIKQLLEQQNQTIEALAVDYEEIESNVVNGSYDDNPDSVDNVVQTPSGNVQSPVTHSINHPDTSPTNQDHVK